MELSKFITAVFVGAVGTNIILDKFSNDESGKIKKSIKETETETLITYYNGSDKPINVQLCEMGFLGNTSCMATYANSGQAFYIENLPKEGASILRLSVTTVGFIIDACTAPKMPTTQNTSPIAGQHDVNFNLNCK